MAGARHVVTVTRRSPGRRNWHIECSCGRWWDAIHSFGWTREQAVRNTYGRRLHSLSLGGSR